jgi:hypothetical protein
MQGSKQGIYTQIPHTPPLWKKKIPLGKHNKGKNFQTA